jgi:hypothetical protein
MRVPPVGLRVPPAASRSDPLTVKSEYTMLRRICRSTLRVIPFALLLFVFTAGIEGRTGTKNGEWQTYGGDFGSTKYAPLDQGPGVSR